MLLGRKEPELMQEVEGYWVDIVRLTSTQQRFWNQSAGEELNCITLELPWVRGSRRRWALL